MKRIQKLICIFLLIFTIVTMPITQVEAKKKRSTRASYKTSKSISKKTTKKNKKPQKNVKTKNKKKTTKSSKAVKTKKSIKKTNKATAKNTKQKNVKAKDTKTKNVKNTKTKANVQKQAPNKIVAITLPSQKRNSSATHNGQKREPRRCPNVRCRYIGVKPCPWHGKDYPNHWK